MKHLLSSILIMMAISSASYAAVTKTEIKEERVCLAVAGCSIDAKTGDCPDCVVEIRRVVTEINDPVVKVRSIAKTSVISKPVSIAKKLSTKPGKCFFPELGWPTGKINPNTFEIITTGEWHDCDYYDWGKNTTIAIEKGIKECGRYMNWTWTNDRQTEYKCKG
jgi:hypothetical protein